MIFHIDAPADGDWTLSLDGAGIEWLRELLEELEELEPDGELVANTVGPNGVAAFVVRRAADADPS